MKIKKAISCILCASLICASLSACGDGITNEVKDQIVAKENKAIVSQVVETLAATGTSDARKEETVYVKTNANGEVDSVIVSSWLKNTDNSAELVDSTDLSDIKNVKGKESFTAEGTKLVWDANGSDIYYQGTTDKELPVSVNISYELDGKKIQPEELAGKSGHIKITVNYVNNSANQVVLNGKEETIYTPFVAVSGMIIDQSKFANVEVTNGTVISDGLRNIVVGMAFPGLVESLNGGKEDDSDMLQEIEEKVNIPGQVVVEADVNDFAMGMTLTMVSSDVTKTLGLDDISADKDTAVNDIKDKVTEFSDAGKELTEGTGSLKDGAQKLADGSDELVSGTEKLHEGIVAYTEGVDKVAEGAGKLSDGASKLDNGASELTGGINQVADGINNLDDGVKKVNDGAKQLSDGANAALTGAQNVANGAESLSNGVSTLAGQMQDIANGVGTASNAASQISAGIDAIVSATETVTTGDDIDVSGISVTGALSDEQLAGIISAITGNMSDDTLKNTYGLTDEQIAAVKAMVAGVAGQILPSTIDTVATTVAKETAKQAGATAANTTKANINYALTHPVTDGGTSLKDGAEMLSLSLANSYATLSSDATAAQLMQLTQGAADLATGAANLSTGIGSLKTGADSLYAGTTSLSLGSAQLRAGIGRLSTGASTLKDGTSALLDGTSTLVAGTGELSSNSAALVEGSKTLAEGSVTLKDGINSLAEGTVKLNDGMVKFNEEGIEKLTDVFDTDIAGMTDRIKAISDAGKAYTTFSGTDMDEDCSVKFIIETAEIK